MNIYIYISLYISRLKYSIILSIIKRIIYIEVYINLSNFRYNMSFKIWLLRIKNFLFIYEQIIENTQKMFSQKIISRQFFYIIRMLKFANNFKVVNKICLKTLFSKQLFKRLKIILNSLMQYVYPSCKKPSLETKQL